MDKDKLINVLTGEATEQEKEKFYVYLNDNPHDKKIFFELKSLWLKASMKSMKVDVDSVFKKVWNSIENPHKKRFAIKRLRAFQYAASFLIILGMGALLGYYLLMDQMNLTNPAAQVYTTQKGSVSSVEFSDGTKVWLNSGSKLTYYEDHNKKERRASLTGEAYFEVEHKDDFLFYVNVGEIVVKDLGTTFNIKAYAEDNYIETSLIEGEADILNKDGETLAKLNPGKGALYSKNDNEIEMISFSSTNVLSAWRDGRFVFRNKELKDVFNDLSRWYDVDFKINNESIKHLKYNGNIKKTTTVSHVLEMLKLTTSFQYKVIDKKNGKDLIIIY